MLIDDAVKAGDLLMDLAVALSDKDNPIEASEILENITGRSISEEDVVSIREYLGT